jgi:hypothetical protein
VGLTGKRVTCGKHPEAQGLASPFKELRLLSWDNGKPLEGFQQKSVHVGDMLFQKHLGLEGCKATTMCSVKAVG